MEFQNLPGSEFIGTGIQDLLQNQETIASLLISIGWQRLNKYISDLPKHGFNHPEHRLYKLLARENPDSAHSRYNALLRRLVSFERALACVD